MSTRGQPIRWVAASQGVVPEGAVVGGFDGEDTYVARAAHRGDMLPGKLHVKYSRCYVGWDCLEHEYDTYEVLCGSGKWIRGDQFSLECALQGGETSTGEPLFVGRTMHDGLLISGYVHLSHDCCFVSHDGKEYGYQKYEVFIEE